MKQRIKNKRKIQIVPEHRLDTVSGGDGEDTTLDPYVIRTVPTGSGVQSATISPDG